MMCYLTTIPYLISTWVINQGHIYYLVGWVGEVILKVFNQGVPALMDVWDSTESNAYSYISST